MRPEGDGPKRGRVVNIFELHEAGANAHGGGGVDDDMEVLVVIRSRQRCNRGELVAQRFEGGAELEAIQNARHVGMLGLELVKRCKRDVQVFQEARVERYHARKA